VVASVDETAGRMELAEHIKTISLSPRHTIRDALKAIDLTGWGIAFVLDEDERLVGLASDGDLRRALLKGCGLGSRLSEILSGEFVSATVHDSAEAVAKLFSEKIHLIPILDDRRRVVDVAFYDRRARLPIASPHLGEAELTYVADCVLSGWISSSGGYVKRFEELLAEFVDVEFGISVSSGTAALHLALGALDIGPGDEVIVPTLTFAATVNAVLYAGATPVFVDSEPETWNMDPEQVRAAVTPRSRAIIPVHLYGHPADMAPIMEVARQHGLDVVEDAAEAHGARFKDAVVGSIGRVGCFSFYGNKIVTTGEGGAVMTNDPAVAEKVRLLRDHGMSPTRRYWHEVIGYNYRMTNLQAAVGTAQLEAVERIIARKMEIARTYDAGFRNLPAVERPPCAPWATPVCWLYTMLLKPDTSKVSRDELITRLSARGIDTRPMFYPIHTMPPYRKYARRAFPVAERLSAMGVSLPSSVRLKTEEVKFIVDQVRTILDR